MTFFTSETLGNLPFKQYLLVLQLCMVLCVFSFHDWNDQSKYILPYSGIFIGEFSLIPISGVLSLDAMKFSLALVLLANPLPCTRDRKMFVLIDLAESGNSCIFCWSTSTTQRHIKSESGVPYYLL